MSEVFPRKGRMAKGYDPIQVNEFFTQAREAYEGRVSAQEFSSEQVRSVAFDEVRHGYDPEAVDAALDRLEAAFAKRDRADHVAVNGKQAWLDRVAERATTLYPRLLRPAGERFTHPQGRELGYSLEQVDEFMTKLIAFFDEGAQLTADEVRHVQFKDARKQKAYATGPVDAYLARATEVLLAVE